MKKLVLLAASALAFIVFGDVPSDMRLSAQSDGNMVVNPTVYQALHWRCRVVADLVASVKAALPATTRLAVIPTVQRPPAAAWL